MWTVDKYIPDGYVVGGGGGGDTTPPTITIVSPTPGVLPGAPGGFPADFGTATNTPIVFTVTDAAPGLAFLQVFFLIGGRKNLMYYRGAFEPGFAVFSRADVITNGFQFTVRADNGWPPGDGSTTTFQIIVDALDGAGNIAP